MRRGFLMIILIMGVGCSSNAGLATSEPIPATATLQAPTLTRASNPAVKPVPPQFIANRTNAEQTAIDLYEIAANGEVSLKQSLACPSSPCEQTPLNPIPNQPAFAMVIGDQGQGGELYEVNYALWEATNIADQVQMSSLAITPDGSKIAFLRLRSDTSAPVALGAIWVYDVASQQTEQISEWAAFYDDLIWLDNQQLMFSRAMIGTPPRDWRTWLIDLHDPTQVQEIDQGRVQAIVGEQQVFIEHEKEQGSDLNPLIQIQRYDLVAATTTEISDWYDRYSQTLQIRSAPNHQKAALVAGGEPEMLGMTTPPQLGVDLTIVQATDANQEAFFVTCTECYPTWSSASQTLLFFNSNNAQLVLVDATTGTMSQQPLPKEFYPQPGYSLNYLLMLD